MHEVLGSIVAVDFTRIHILRSAEYRLGNFLDAIRLVGPFGMQHLLNWDGHSTLLRKETIPHTLLKMHKT